MTQKKGTAQICYFHIHLCAENGEQVTRTGGGRSGYADLLDALNNPDHEQHLKIEQWLKNRGKEPCDPKNWIWLSQTKCSSGPHKICAGTPLLDTESAGED
jgi:hypothetical protein